jgi:hypothetical protein
MTWTRPFFLHLRVPAGAVRDHIPSGLTLETDGDEAFVSLVALDATGPAPGPIAHTRLGRLLAYRQLDTRAYVTGPHGPGLYFIDIRVDRVFPLVGRAAGLPYRVDPRLAFSADEAGVALRAGGVAVKGLPEPGAAHAIDDERDRRLLDRAWSYSRVPGALVANRVEHPSWRVRNVAVDPDLRLGIEERGLRDAKLISAQLAETLPVAIAELKIYRRHPFKQARGATA